MRDCIEVIEAVMRKVSSGGAEIPPRGVIPITEAGSLFGIMPGYLRDPVSFGAKLLSVRLASTEGAPSHVGVFVLFDAHAGPVAILNASELTAVRTAAASAVATRALARPDSAELAILGTGEQAARHLEALSMVRPLRNVRIWGRSPEKTSAFVALQSRRNHVPLIAASSVREAVDGADLICTTTASREPVLQGGWLSPGMHINLIGASLATHREADDELVARSRFYVDYRPSALAQAGELLHAIERGLVTESHISGEIGEVLNGTVPGRRRVAELTVYKSLGISVQDLAAAQRVYEHARKMGLGVPVSL
jgi:ornithine cyclodeaminase